MAYEDYDKEGESYPHINHELRKLDMLFSELKYPYDFRGETEEEAQKKKRIHRSTHQRRWNY